MNVLVTGGTGVVGSQVVRELQARGASVRVLTRSSEKAKAMPEGVEGVVGDLLSPDTVRTAFRGVDGVFLINGVSTTEGHEGLMGVNGARMAGVGRLVYLSVQDAERAAHLPHFGAKVGVETAVARSGISYTILRPNNFFQNDNWLREPILKYGVYAQPIGDVGVSRVDVRDIAEAAAVALTTPGHEAQTYNVVGPDVHTGVSTAEEWSRALGRPITYAGNDLEAWERQQLAYLPDWMVFDFRLMYEHFQRNGFRSTPADVERMTAVLGRPPRSFRDFATETAASWTT